MKIYDVAIDYGFVNSFHLHELVSSLVLPIKKDGLYFNFFSCDDSKIDEINKDSLPINYYLSKEDILFFLSDLEIRLELYSLSKNALLSDDYDSNYIYEFFSILVEKAVFSRSSDIHIESFENSSVIRFRIDGTLKIFYVFDKELIKVLSSYIKMLSKLDITNFRTPMDGAFSMNIDNKKYDFRVSSMPTTNGESIVIRVLSSQTINKKIKDLGFSKSTLNAMEDITKLTQGLVLISGPTGSGKSTTLYSILKRLNNENKKIITVEDPVEYKIQQVQQVEIKEDIGMGFDTILRNILRQDPDVILIGEIRDTLSLNIALQASLTGHLVLASIHAKSSIETLGRLIDLKADRYLLSTTLKYIIAQRLVLTICKECNNKGCEKCNFSGFYGRSSLSEVLKIDEEISSIIFKNESFEEYLTNTSFKTILDDGKRRVKEGITTLDEVYKVIEN